jgi:HD-GYP domain-containing protein (c-di-GMP phosphodiesterase class II)
MLDDVKNKSLKIDFPVYTLDRKLTVPAGTEITDQVMKDIISKNKDAPYREYPFSECEPFFSDFKEFLQEPPYDIMFYETRNKEVLSLVENISIIDPALEVLDYFKTNDLYTYRHILIVFAMSTLMSAHFIIDEKSLFTEIMAGSLHDIGKICVPLDILKKTKPLSKDEKKMLEHHTVAGYIIISYLLKNYESFASKVCFEHHERLDGSGYPFGILQNDRRVEIIAVSDVYDALLSQRPYRLLSYDNRGAIEEITEMAVKGKLSWNIVKVLVAYSRRETDVRNIEVSMERRGRIPQSNVYGIIEEKDNEDKK